MSKWLRLATVAVNSAVAITPSLVTLLFVDASVYGYFSLIYIAYIIGSNLLYSAVLEAIVRSGGSGKVFESRELIAVITQLSIVVGVLASVIALGVIGMKPATIAGGVALGLTNYRHGCRYVEVYNNRYLIAVRADAMFLVGLLIGWICFWQVAGEPTLDTVFLSWSIAGVMATLAGTKPDIGKLTLWGRWYRRYKKQINPLLGEAGVTEISNVLSPIVLVPLLTVSQFGIYRATFNISAPMRAIMGAVRPYLSRFNYRDLASLRFVMPLWVISCAIGGITYVALKVVGEVGWFGGAIQGLIPHSIAVASYTAINLVCTYWYIVSRMHSSTRRLLIARIGQSVLYIFLPMVGAMINGISGAIWAIAVAVFLASVLWTWAAKSSDS